MLILLDYTYCDMVRDSPSEHVMTGRSSIITHALVGFATTFGTKFQNSPPKLLRAVENGAKLKKHE